MSAHDNVPEPTASAGRLEFVDSLRGFALFGVYWANLLIFSGLAYMTDEQKASLFAGRQDSIMYFAMKFLIEDKFMGLFSCLFGVSFWLFLDRVGRRTASPVALFNRRIFWLFLIGAIHGWLFWCFDILRFYALWALLLPLFARLKPKHLLMAALLAGVVVPAILSGVNNWWVRPITDTTDYEALALDAFSKGSYVQMLIANWIYDWYLTLEFSQLAYQIAILGRLLLGLYVARTLDLGNLDRHRSLLKQVLWIGGLTGIIGNVVFAGHLFAGVAGHPWWAVGRRLILESGKLGMTLAYASAMALAYLSLHGRKVVRVLAPIGQMALTWYLFQTAFGIWLFYGFPRGPGLMGQVGPAALAAIACTGYVVQVVLARGWMSRFRFGPAEWCWRSLTYWKVQPLAIARAADPPSR